MRLTRSVARAPLQGKGHAAIVAAMSRVLGELSREIAAAIQAL